MSNHVPEDWRERLLDRYDTEDIINILKLQPDQLIFYLEDLIKERIDEFDIDFDMEQGNGS